VASTASTAKAKLLAIPGESGRMYRLLEVAHPIQANIVRIGSKICGERDYGAMAKAPSH